jgi:enolase
MIKAKIIKNSRGEKTTEVDYKGFKGSCPSGASTGKTEEKKFKEKIENAVKDFNKISKQLEKLEIKEFDNLKYVEELLKKFGSNIHISTEFAILHAKGGYKWISNNKKFPKPLGNVVGGGAHLRGEGTNFQEFLVVDNHSKTFLDSAFTNKKIHRELGEEFESFDGFRREMTDEGAWAPKGIDNEDVLALVKKVARKNKADIGLDIAASEFFENGKYKYNEFTLNRDEQIDFVNRLIKKYNLYYVEDPLEESDFDGFSHINKKHLVCGDDLTTTHVDLLKKAVEKNSINSIIIKPNQVGSLIGMKDTVEYAKKNKIKTIFSHRSGETLDNALAHLALGFSADHIKISVFGKERESKIDELIRLERSINSKA